MFCENKITIDSYVAIQQSYLASYVGYMASYVAIDVVQPKEWSGAKLKWHPEVTIL